jgi:hypothetical protein
MTERDIAKSAFEFVREADKKWCKRWGVLFNDFQWNNLVMRQVNSWLAIAKWHRAEIRRLKLNRKCKKI